MASNFLNALKNLRANLHNVGNLNNWRKGYLNQGAVATANMDNFTLVKLGFDAQTGERTATPLAANNEKGHLVASVEDYMNEYETISSFFNAQGERVRVVRMEPGMRFECSNFELENPNAVAASPLKNGLIAHYRADVKKFYIWNVRTAGTNDYTNAANKLVVVDANAVSIDGQPVVRFEVVE